MRKWLHCRKSEHGFYERSMPVFTVSVSNQYEVINEFWLLHNGRYICSTAGRVSEEMTSTLYFPTLILHGTSLKVDLLPFKSYSIELM